MQLVIEAGTETGQTIPLEGDAFVVGRGEASDLRLPETGISRQHARFQPGPQGWTLVDLGSTNGTFVNGQRLASDQPYLLKPGDRIVIGSTLLLVRPDRTDLAAAEEMMPGRRRGRPRPVLMAVGAMGLVAALAGIVILLVTLLQPDAGPATPTVAGPLDQIATAFPVPTGLQGVMTSVATVLPTGFPPLPFGPTPTPEAALPCLELAKALPVPAAPEAAPSPRVLTGSGNGTP